MKFRLESGHTNSHHVILDNRDSKLIKEIDWNKFYNDFQKRIIKEQRSEKVVTLVFLFMFLYIFTIYLFMILIVH